MSNARNYHFPDHIIIGIQKCLQTLTLPLSSSSHRPSPSEHLQQPTLSATTQKLSAGLMRVNHSGEVCAQALYLGQSFFARDKAIHQGFQQAATEEAEHLQWCAQRLTELNTHTSYLNPLWFTGSLMIGTCAGLFGDKISLGFLAETEHQVSAHLARHLEKLPSEDLKSRAIVKQMQQDEMQHAAKATELGAIMLPWPVKFLMRATAKVMTQIAYYV